MFKVLLLVLSLSGHVLSIGVGEQSFATKAACDAVLPAKIAVATDMQSAQQHQQVRVVGRCAPAAAVDKIDHDLSKPKGTDI